MEGGDTNMADAPSDRRPEVPGGAAPVSDATATDQAPGAQATIGPRVLTELVCERCGNVSLVRVKGCWYCEKCHYKFDCYGW